MLDILRDENLEKILDAFLSKKRSSFDEDAMYLNSEKVYDTIIDADESQSVSELDKQKQQNLVDFMSRMYKFKEGYSPADGFMGKDVFCRAYSANGNPENTRHRLYFNMGDNRMEFVDLLTRKLNSRNIPFAIKWDKHSVRRDNLVMYIEEEFFEDTTKVIKEVVIKYPEFAKTTDIPMAVVNGGWFGYGVEKPYTNTSHNGRMVDCVQRALMRSLSDYRDCFDISSVTEFSEFLYEQCAQILRSTKKATRQEVHENGKILKPLFEQNSLSIARHLLHKDEGMNGFAVTENGEDAVADDKPVRTIYDYGSKKSMEITPSAVMNTLLRMTEVGLCEFKINSEEKKKLIETIKVNLEKEIEKEGLPTEMPEILKELASINVVTRHHEVEDSQGVM